MPAALDPVGGNSMMPGVRERKAQRRPTTALTSDRVGLLASLALLGAVRTTHGQLDCDPASVPVRSPQSYNIDWNDGASGSETSYIAPGDTLTWRWDMEAPGTNVFAQDNYRHPILADLDPWPVFASSGEPVQTIGAFEIVFSRCRAEDTPTAEDDARNAVACPPGEEDARLSSGNLQRSTTADTRADPQSEQADGSLGLDLIYEESGLDPARPWAIFDQERFIEACRGAADAATGEVCRFNYESGLRACTSAADVTPGLPGCASAADIVPWSQVVVEEPCPCGSFSSTCDDHTTPRGACDPWAVSPSSGDFFLATEGTACSDRVWARCTNCACGSRQQWEATACQGGGDPAQNRECANVNECTLGGGDPRVLTPLNEDGSQTCTDDDTSATFQISTVDYVCGCCDADCPAGDTNFPAGAWWDVDNEVCRPTTPCPDGMIGVNGTATSNVECRFCGGDCISIREDAQLDLVLVIDDSGSVTDVYDNEPAFQSEVFELLLRRLNSTGNIARTMAISTTLPNQTYFGLTDDMSLEDRIATLPRQDLSDRTEQGYLGDVFRSITRRFEQAGMARSIVIVVLYDGYFGEDDSQDNAEQAKAAVALQDLGRLRHLQQDFAVGGDWSKAYEFGDVPAARWVFSRYVPRPGDDNGFTWQITELDGNGRRHFLRFESSDDTIPSLTFTLYFYDLATNDPNQQIMGTAVWDGQRLTYDYYGDIITWTPSAGTLPAITGSDEKIRLAMVSFGRAAAADTVAALARADRLDPNRAVLDVIRQGTESLDRQRTFHFQIQQGRKNNMLELDQVVAQCFTNDTAIQRGICNDQLGQSTLGCAFRQFEEQRCTATDEQVCRAETFCDPVHQFEAVRPTPGTDRVCNFSVPCPERTYELSPLTFSSDRVCVRVPDCVDELDACEAQAPRNGGCGDACASSADPDSYVPCWSDIGLVGVDEYQGATPTATSDRNCTVITVCDGRYKESTRSRYQYASVFPTATTDRECRNCTSTATLDSADFVFAIDSSGSIEDTLYGGEDGNFDLIKNFVRSMIQARPAANRHWTDDVYLRGAAGSKFAAIQFGDTARVNFRFNDNGYQTLETMETVTNNVSYDGGETNMHLAIQLFIDDLLNPDPVAMRETGFRNFTVPVVFVIITDGNPTNETATREQIARFTQEPRLLTALNQGDLILYPVALGPARSNAVHRVRQLFDMAALVAPENQDRVVVPSIYDLVNSTFASVSSLANRTVTASLLEQMAADLTIFAPKCDDSEFISQPCGNVSDIVCSPLNTCNIGSSRVQYIQAHPTRTSDRVCGLLRRCPAPSKYELAPPQECYGHLTEGRMSPSPVDYCSDRECGDATICDPCTEFQTADLTETTDRVCHLLSSCPVGFYTSTPSTEDTDRVCEACLPPCSPGYFESIPCQHDTCTSGVQPANSTNRQCTVITTCTTVNATAGVTAYEAQPATATTDSGCAQLTVCIDPDEYEATAPSETSDRVCGTSPVCGEDQFEGVAQTATTPRTCVDRTVCAVDDEYENVEAASPTSDRECLPVTTCNLRQFMAAPPTTTADRSCLNVTGDGTTCPVTQWRRSPANLTADIVCFEPIICRFRTEYMVAEFTPTSDRVCADMTFCRQGDQYEMVDPSPTSDRGCANCSICAGVADQISVTGLPIPGVSLSGDLFAGLGSLGSGDVILAIDRRSGFAEQIMLARFMVSNADTSESGTHFAVVSFGTNGAVLEIGFQSSEEALLVELGLLEGRRAEPSSAREFYPMVSSYNLIQNALLANSQGPVAAGVSGTGVRYRGGPSAPFPTSIVFMVSTVSSFEVVALGPAVTAMQALSASMGWPEGRAEIVRRHIVSFGPRISAIIPLAIRGDVGQWHQLASAEELVDPVNMEEVLMDFCREGCPEDWFESSSCQVDADRVCSRTTQCDATSQYESTAAEADSDRECSDATVCVDDEYERTPLSATSDRTCLPITICVLPAQFQSSPATSTSDAVCDDTTVCLANREFESVLPTGTSDRSCLTYGPCGSHQFEDARRPVTTADGCSNLTICDADEFEWSPPEVDADRACRALTVCRPYEYESVRVTTTTDRRCGRCTPCFGDSLDLYFVLSRAFSIDHSGEGSVGHFDVLKDLIEYIVNQAPTTVAGSDVPPTFATVIAYPSNGSQTSTHTQDGFDVSEFGVNLARPALASLALAGTDSAWVDVGQAGAELARMLDVRDPQTRGSAKAYFLSDGRFLTNDQDALFSLKTRFADVEFEVVTIGQLMTRRPDLLTQWQHVSSSGNVHIIEDTETIEATVNALLDAVCTPCGPGSFEVHPCSTTPAASVPATVGCQSLSDAVSGSSCDVLIALPGDLCLEADIFQVCNLTCSRHLHHAAPDCNPDTPAPTASPTPAPTACPAPITDSVSSDSCRRLAQEGLCESIFAVCERTCSAWLNISTLECMPAPGTWFRPLAYNKVCASLTACEPIPLGYEVSVPSITSDRSCAATSSCGSEQFESISPTAETDRLCVNFRECDLATEYIAQDATATSDRICAALTACAADQYISVQGSRYRDHTCASLASDCAGDEYECASPDIDTDRVCCTLRRCISTQEFMASAPTATTDRVCEAITDCNATTEYEAASPTADSDRACNDATVCGAGEFESGALTATSDRVCSTISAPCAVGEFESSAPTVSADRVCERLTDCAAGQEFESTQATAVTDRDCTAATVCTDLQFVTRQLTAGLDRVCQNFTACSADNYQTVEPTATSDRLCTDCTVCGTDEFAARVCLVAADTMCRPLLECTNTQYQRDPAPTYSTNRVCRDATVCREGQYVAQPLTVTSDRVCRFRYITYCDCASEYEVIPATPTTNATCRPYTPCLDTEYESEASTCSSDRLCVGCTELQGICTGFPNDLLVVLDQSDSVENPAFGGVVGQFGDLQDAANELMTTVEVAATGTHVAAITFGSDATVEFTFGNSTATVDQLQYSERGVTSLDVAITLATSELLTRTGTSGFRGAPIPGSSVAVVYFTDLLLSTEMSDGSVGHRDRVLAALAAVPAGVSQFTWWQGEYHRIGIVDSGGGPTIELTLTDLPSIRNILCPSSCAPGHFLESTCSTASDSICSRFTDCSPEGQFEQQAPTISTDRICTDAQICLENEFESDPLTGVSDRGCTELAVCEPDQFQSDAPTINSDRRCVNASTCDCSNQYESLAMTGTSDRQCTYFNQPECPVNQYEVAAPTCSSDRLCAGLTVCSPGQLELSPPDTTTDRICDDYRSSWARYNGFCASTGASWPRTAAGLEWNATSLQECEAHCAATSGCRSFVRGNAEVASCILNTHGDTCCRSLVHSPDWVSWISPDCDDTEDCSLDYSTPQVALSPGMERNPNGAGSQHTRWIEIEPVRTWETLDQTYCTPFLPGESITFGGRSLLDETDRTFVERSCQTACANLEACSACSVGTGLVSSTPECWLADATCLDVVGQGSSAASSFTWTTFVRPGARDECSGLTCPESPECYLQAECSAGKCIATATAETGLSCDDGLAFSPTSECRRGICEGSCPASMFLASSPIPEYTGDIPVETAHCALIARACCNGEYERLAPTTSSDRICAALTICPSSTWECGAPTATENRQCCNVTDCCAIGRIEVTAATGFADTVCEDVRVCDTATEYEVIPLADEPCPGTNRVCSPLRACGLGDPQVYGDAGTWETYESQAPTESSDRGCSMVSRCLSAGCATFTPPFVASPHTTTADRACECLQDCADGTFQVTPLRMLSPEHLLSTETERYAEQRSCSRCTRHCSNRTAMDMLFIVDESGSIELPYAGGRPGDFDLEKNFFERIVNGVSEVSLDGTRIATVSYSRNAQVDFDFDDHSDAAGVISHLRRLDYAGLDTRLGQALNTARLQLLTADAGFRDFTVPAIVVMMVDGQINGDTNTELDNAIQAWQALSNNSDASRATVTTWVYVNVPSDGSAVRAGDMARFVDIAGDPSRVIEVSNFAANLPTLAAEFLSSSWLGQRCLPGCDERLFFERVACTTESDRECEPLTTCTDTEYQMAAPTQSTDRVCPEVSTCHSFPEFPSPTEFEFQPPTSTTDRRCHALAVCDMESSYVLVPPTATSDRRCGSRRRCTADQYQSVAPTRTSQRVCSPIQPCTEHQYQVAPATDVSNTVCRNITACGDEFYECSAPTLRRDRTCCSCTECSGAEYSTGCADGISDRTCQPVTECECDTDSDGTSVSGEFEVAGPTSSSDRICSEIRRACVDGIEIESRAPSCSSQRVCERVVDCCTNFYESAPATNVAQPVCLPITECLPTEFMTVPATRSSDAACATIAACDFVRELESQGATEVSDTTCEPLTVCGENQYVSTRATMTSQRSCATLSCSDSAYCLTQDAHRCPTAGEIDCTCTELTVCDEPNQFEATPASMFSNRLCLPVSTCEEAVEIERTAPTSTTDRVCCQLAEASADLSGLGRFGAPAALLNLPESQGTTRSPSSEDCADACFREASFSCRSFAFSAQYSTCLFFSDASAGTAGSEPFHDFQLYVRAAPREDGCADEVDSGVALVVDEGGFTVVGEQFIAEPIDGSVARANLDSPSAFEVHHDCYTAEECNALCGEDDSCVGFDYSDVHTICVILTEYLPRAAEVGDGFVHFTKRPSDGRAHTDVLAAATYFGGAAYPVSIRGRTFLLLDGDQGTHGVVATEPNPASFLSIRLRFKPANASEFSYLLSKSTDSGVLRRYAVGVTSRHYVEPAIWVYHTVRGNTSHGLLKFAIPRQALSDGQYHDVAITIYGTNAEFTFDGATTHSAQLSAPFEDGPGDLHIGQRAPGRYRFRGAIERLDIAGPEISGALVPPAAHQLGNTVANCSHVPAFLVLDGEGGKTVQAAPSVGSTFSVAFTVRMNVGSSGYVFARTNTAGTLRRYALYVPRVGRARFYYKTTGSTNHRIAYLSAGINDGVEHRVILGVSGRNVRLTVDAGVSAGVLAGSIDDCTESSSGGCILRLGQRPSAVGGAYGMSGVITEFVVHPTAVFARYPTTGRFESVNLLEGALAVTDTGAVAVEPDGSLSFDGSSSRHIALNPTSFAAFTLDVRFSGTRAESGYLVAYTDLAGDNRHLALYSSVDGFVWLFYRTAGGVDRSARFTHDIDTTDSSVHRLSLAVFGTTITFQLDSYVVTRQLHGEMEPCSGDCSFVLGRREPGLHGLVGTLREATFRSFSLAA